MFGAIDGFVLAHERCGCGNLGETKAFFCTTSVVWEVWCEQSIACKCCLPFTPWLIGVISLLKMKLITWEQVVVESMSIHFDVYFSACPYVESYF